MVFGCGLYVEVVVVFVGGFCVWIVDNELCIGEVFGVVYFGVY